MMILVDPGSFDCANAGDVSMLVVAVRRLSEHFPGCEIRVFTNAPETLARHCPSAVGVPHLHGREAWRRGSFLLGRVGGRLPLAVRAAWERGATTARRRWPRAYGGAVARRLGAIDAPRAAAAAYLRAIEHADLYVVAGQGTLADEARVQAEAVLDTCDLLMARGVPVVFLAQGVGPLRDTALRTRVGRTLRSAAFVSLRERPVAHALLAAAGVPASSLRVTGDDAIELAYERRPADLGRGLGVHVRNAPLAMPRAADRARLRDVVHRLGAALGAPLVPLPISRHRVGADDAATLRALVDGYPSVDADAQAAEGPLDVIAAAGRCRAVLSGAYHAAVFALAQGVPTVCIGTSDYYLHKFDGLRELFGPGCTVLRLTDEGVEQRVEDAVRRAWRTADVMRPSLLAAATSQIALGHAAYADMAARVTQSRARAERLPAGSSE